MSTNHCISKPLVLGKIGHPSGVHGWVKLLSFTEKKNDIFHYQPWFFQSTEKYWEPIEIEDFKKKKTMATIKIKGIENREKANVLVHQEIFIDSSQLPAIENCKGYYWKDLIGCLVYDSYQCKIGKVASLIHTGSNDVLVIHSEKSNTLTASEILVPFLEDTVIKKVDLYSHVIEIDWDLSF